ncbi:MAG: hypothetical protein FWD06_02250 [Oscillospiraceae bacterium]|nr:hypothetical protein [Oscillospiraceae bacterium]
MRNFKAIFRKQLLDSLKNMEIMLNFALYPFMGFLMSTFASPNFDGVPEEIQQMLAAGMPNMMMMMATMFAGMGLIPVVASIISEDIEKKSLRFLTMAGVKPMSYLLGVGAVSFFLAIFTTFAFGFIGDFGGTRELLVFVAAMLSGVIASIFLGATLGILSRSQQASTGLTMPAAVVLGFGPMLAQFNGTISRLMTPFYTQQLNAIADYFSGGPAAAPLWQSFAIIWANVIVLGIVFAVVYRKKGLAQRG